MQGLAVDDAAWASAWRGRAVADKAVLALGLVLCAAVLPAWPGSLLVTVVALTAATAFARTPWPLLLRTLAAPAAFVVLGGVSVAITVRGAPDWGVGATDESVRRALEVTAHAVAGTSAMILLAVTTPMVDLLAGLRPAGVRRRRGVGLPVAVRPADVAAIGPPIPGRPARVLHPAPLDAVRRAAHRGRADLGLGSSVPARGRSRGSGVRGGRSGGCRSAAA
nr:energy-coupling factor transporter transmembrane component T [Rhodococcus corynebacterioides]